MLKTIIITKATDHPKGWGKEVWVGNNIILPGEPFPTGYSGKFLVYEKEGALSSMHFHTVKHETFYVLYGRYQFRYYNPENADLLTVELGPGDVVIIPPCNPHQLLCLEKGTIVEYASTDYSWDNFRIGKGDSQTKIE